MVLSAYNPLRGLSDSIDRIRRLEDEKNMLAVTLRRICESGSLPPDQHSDVLLLLQKVGFLRVGEHSAPVEVGFPGQKTEMTRIPYLSNGSGKVGFVGKMSETSWMDAYTNL